LQSYYALLSGARFQIKQVKIPESARPANIRLGKIAEAAQKLQKHMETQASKASELRIEVGYKLNICF
jgi:hypothetical protein